MRSLWFMEQVHESLFSLVLFGFFSFPSFLTTNTNISSFMCHASLDSSVGSEKERTAGPNTHIKLPSPDQPCSTERSIGELPFCCHVLMSES